MTGAELEAALNGGGGGGSGGGCWQKSIKDFGAKGDGVTNDTAALKAAAASGEAVYFPQGTYLLYEQIDMSADLYWYGDGPLSIIKLMPYDQSRPEQYDGRTVYNTYMLTQSEDVNGYTLYLRDIVLDANKAGYENDILGNGSSKYDHVTCLDLYQPKDVYLQGVIIRNALIEGCYIYDANSIIIDNSQFLNNGYYREDASGLHIEGDSPHAVISNCLFNGNGFNGFLTSGSHMTISNISCCDNGYDGLVLWGGASYNTITGVFCSGNRAGVSLKTQYSPYIVDYIDEDWLSYAKGNIISGLRTHSNSYGILFGLSEETLISDWFCESDTYALACAASASRSTEEYLTSDITGTVCNAQLDYTSYMAYAVESDTSIFKIQSVSGSGDLVSSSDWITDGQDTNSIEWESGRISNSGGGTEEDDSTSIRTVGYLYAEPSTSYNITNSVGKKAAAFWYDTSKGYLSREYCNSGASITSPATAAFVRFVIEGETSLDVQLTIVPPLPES